MNNRYKSIELIGAGPIGMVYKCRHEELSGQLVAMKVLHKELCPDKNCIERFREAVSTSYRINHPNTVRVFEYFKDKDVVAFTMEYIDGVSLATLFYSGKVYNFENDGKLLCGILNGLAAVHEEGLILKNLKAENILFTKDNIPKISDYFFGDFFRDKVSAAIDFPPPEYLNSGQIDSRADIYALGNIVYEWVTGEMPFKSKSVIDCMNKRLHGKIIAPSEIRKECPRPLNDWILKALCHDPDLRFATVREALETFEAEIMF